MKGPLIDAEGSPNILSPRPSPGQDSPLLCLRIEAVFARRRPPVTCRQPVLLATGLICHLWRFPLFRGAPAAPRHLQPAKVAVACVHDSVCQPARLTLSTDINRLVDGLIAASTRRKRRRNAAFLHHEPRFLFSFFRAACASIKIHLAPVGLGGLRPASRSSRCGVSPRRLCGVGPWSSHFHNKVNAVEWTF